MQALDRSHAHDGITQPVDTSDKNLLPCLGGTLHGVCAVSAARALIGAGFHRLCTQNQLAGSRRIASSKSRFTSSMISSDDLPLPFSIVAISFPSSSRHLARPVRKQYPVNSRQR